MRSGRVDLVQLEVCARCAREVREVREGGGQEGGVGFRGAVHQQHALTRAAAPPALQAGARADLPVQVAAEPCAVGRPPHRHGLRGPPLLRQASHHERLRDTGDTLGAPSLLTLSHSVPQPCRAFGYACHRTRGAGQPKPRGAPHTARAPLLIQAHGGQDRRPGTEMVAREGRAFSVEESGGVLACSVLL